MLDGLTDNLGLLDWLKLLLNLLDLINKKKGDDYQSMFDAIDDEKVVRRSKDAKDLAELVGDGIRVTDQDGISHTIKTIDEAIALIESGKELTLVDDSVQETIDPVITTTVKVIPKITDCCETCGEVTCVCDS